MIYAYSYTYAYAHTYTYDKCLLYLSLSLSMYIYIYICTYIYIYIYIYISLSISLSLSIYIYIYIYIHMCIDRYIYIYIYTHTCMYSCWFFACQVPWATLCDKCLWQTAATPRAEALDSTSCEASLSENSFARFILLEIPARISNSFHLNRTSPYRNLNQNIW